jgi:hypothetical protein
VGGGGGGGGGGGIVRTENENATIYVDIWLKWKTCFTILHR